MPVHIRCVMNPPALAFEELLDALHRVPSQFRIQYASGDLETRREGATLLAAFLVKYLTKDRHD